MKQIISIADFAVMLNLINDKINRLETSIPLDITDKLKTEKDYSKALKENKERLLNHSSYYQSLLHAKQSLEKCLVEIEVPDVEIEKENK